jgi:hypothetical protein
MWVETPWVQRDRAQVQAVVAIPPAFAGSVKEIEVRLLDPDGTILERLPARIESFGPKGLGFVRALAHWSIDQHAPGTYFATAQVRSREGDVLANVAPRMVQEANMTGR